MLKIKRSFRKCLLNQTAQVQTRLVFSFVKKESKIPPGVHVLSLFPEVVCFIHSLVHVLGYQIFKFSSCILIHGRRNIYSICRYQRIHCKSKSCKAYRELPVSRFSKKKPIFITENPCSYYRVPVLLQGFPCKPLYFPVRDYSVDCNSLCLSPITSISPQKWILIGNTENVMSKTKPSFQEGH